MARKNASATKVPTQLQKEARKAEAEYKAAYVAPADAPPPVLEVVQPVGEQPPVETPPVETPPPPLAEGETPPTVETPPVETPPTEPKIDWEQKYRTLDGKYTKEVPRLQRQNSEMVARITGLESKLEATPPATPTETPTDPAAALLTDKEIDDYGGELIDVVKRAAREEFAPELKALREENAKLRGDFTNVESTIVGNAQDSLFDTLIKEVPDWAEINRDTKFLDWLAQPDVYSGLQRQELLTAAFDKSDAARVINFFKGYISEQTPTQVTAPVTPIAPAGSKLDTLVAPSRPKGSTDTGGAQQNELIWTEASIAQFYADVRKGEFKTREKEREALERDIYSAMNTGRIIN